METKQLIADVEKEINGCETLNCDICNLKRQKIKGILLGAISQLKSEKEFLENHLDFIRKARKGVAGLQPFQYPIQERINQITKEIKEYEKKLERLK